MTIFPISSATFHTTVAPEKSPSRKRALEQEEPPKPLFDFESICAAAYSQLLEIPADVSDRNQMAANEFIQMYPDVLAQFSGHRPSYVNRIFERYLETSGYSANDRKSIGRTIKHICLTSVLNSRYQGTIVDIEQNIERYLTASEPEKVQGLVNAAYALVRSPTGKSLSEVQNHLIELNQKESELSETLELFYYASDECREFIEILMDKAVLHNSAPRYPSCKRNFPRFCQNLNILSFEKKELAVQLASVRQKQAMLHTQVSFLRIEQEEKKPKVPMQTMDPEREKFFNGETTLFWGRGSELFKEVFKATLTSYKRTRSTQDFARAINVSAASNAAWSELRSDRFSESPLPEFGVDYVAHVWGLYTEEIEHLTDLADFMRLFLNALSKESFGRLVAAKNKEIAFTQIFFEVFKKHATFMSLKDWVKKQKPFS